jgi:glutamate dehydrogenase (NAD(P)+)
MNEESRVLQDTFSLMDDWGPEKIICVSDPRTGMKGVLVIDNTARGLGKGGVRMSPTLTVPEVARLARVMTWKWALADIFLGGAKAGIRADPRSPDKEAVLRSWCRALRKHIPSEYVAGLDMGMSERDAAVIQDALGDAGASMGTPSALGGVPYDELGLTGYGVAECADAVVQRAGETLQGARVAVQGFGAVGHAAAKRLHELGARIVAISTRSGALAAADGLDVDRLLELRGELGDDLCHAYEGADRIALGDELLLPVDVLIPAAGQDVITERVAARMQARFVVEGANMPTDAAAQHTLRERGVVVAPDVVVNAGAVIAAGAGMSARQSALRLEPGPIFELVSTRLRANVVHVLDRAAALKCTPHEAAVMLAQERVGEAMRLKGRTPALAAEPASNGDASGLVAAARR